MSDGPEFEFFADDTAEIPAQPGPPGRSQSSPTSGLVRRRRLGAGAIASMISLVVIVALATQGSNGPSSAYRRYLANLSPIAAQSQETGRSLAMLLSTMRTGVESDPMPILGHLTRQAQADSARVETLKPPAALAGADTAAVAAMGFRVSGLQGLDRAVGQALGSTGSTGVAAVAAEINRLTTSDVLWADRVSGPIAALLTRSGIKDVAVPQSRFITDLNASTPGAISAWLHPTGRGSSETLALGSRGAAVAAWQHRLNAWLDLTHRTRLTADGNFGASTQAATSALQRARGLTPDGVVGPQTRQALAAALAGSG